MSIAWRISVTFAIALLGACSREPAATRMPEVRASWPSPSRDASTTCADVSELRVCWNAGPSRRDVVVSPRPVPGPALSPLGFRCTGDGASRKCTDRSESAGPFLCTGATCEQHHPRLPDDGEWDCADFAGVVVCRSTSSAAGTPPGSMDAGFVCGPRSGRAAAGGERLCVDLAPDFPDGSPRRWRCRFAARNGLVRRCDRDDQAHTVTDPCDRMHPCISGLSCAAGRCVPQEPAPSCWLDADCDHGSCRFGTCMEDVP